MAEQNADFKAQLEAAKKLIAEQVTEIALLRRQNAAKQDAVNVCQPSQDKQRRAPLPRAESDAKRYNIVDRNLQTSVSAVSKRAGAKPLSITQNLNGKALPPGLPCLASDLSASQTRLPRFKKTGGAADGAGNDYEHKMLTLIFLRMLYAGHKFQLASNMEAAGKFDDIVMRYPELSDKDWNSIFVQLKHKQNKNKCIPKPELLGLSGDFSLISYCHSYETMKLSKELHSFGNVNNSKIIIFTNASIADSLVYEVESDPLLDTGGKVVSFKAGGEVFKELCEWVDIKEALTELHSQVEGLSGEEVERKIIVALGNMNYVCKTVVSFKGELLKTPTLVKLEALLTQLKPVKDKETYASFLAKLQVYTNQAHESKLDAKIKAEFGKVWKCSVDLEASAMLHALQDKVKSWWQKDNFYLTQDSPLWLDVIKPQTELLSKSTIERLTEFEVEFEKSSLQILDDRINTMSCVGGILNLRVDSRTAASALKVHQALVKFRPNDIVLQVNVKALLEREDDLLSAWATHWCHLLVVECNDELDQSQAERIGAKILNIFGSQNKNKLLVLIAPKNHKLNLQLSDIDGYTRFNDNFVWSDLTNRTMENILSNRVEINGIQSTLTLSDLVPENRGFLNKVDLEVMSQFLERDVSCGKDLDKGGKFFVTRRLKKSTYDVPFIMNSPSDFGEKVVLLVAEPGMGKSTLITHLANSAKKEDSSALVVQIKLNDCMQYLKDINVDQFNVLEAKRFLEQSAFKFGNSLEKLIFMGLENKLVIFVDGVDEVCPHYEEQVFKLLGFLKDMKFSRLWVASRPVFQTKLEATLKVKSLTLVAFAAEDRNEFFNNVWMTNVPSASSEKCNEVTESLVTLLNDSLGKDNAILGVPLMVVMIAEIFQERLFSESQSNYLKKNERLDVMTLYKKFIIKKFDLYSVEKKKTVNRELAANIADEETLLKRMLHLHCLAAMRVLFSLKEIAGLHFEGKEKFDQDLATYLKEVSDGREKLGIIDNVIHGIPHFIHRSFAEYFAASWLALNFKGNKRFIEQIIFDPAYKLLSEMFQCSLSGNHPLHVAVVNRDLEETQRLLMDKSINTDVNELDAGGRTPLHLAVLFSGTDWHPDYVSIVKYLMETQIARLDLADEVLGWSPLQYAESLRVWKVLEILLENVDNVGIKNPEWWPTRNTQLLLDAARDANVTVVRYLVEKRRGNLNCRGMEGETLIHRAAEGENIATLKYLLGKIPSSLFLLSFQLGGELNLDTANKEGLTAFQEAAQRGAYEVMSVFLEVKASFGIDLIFKSSEVQLNASLLCAAFAGDLRSVKFLVRKGASFNHRDNKGHTVAWVAMHREKNQVMDWLLLHGSQDGDTPLHRACAEGELEIVTFILTRGDDIDAKGFGGETPLMKAAWNDKLAVMALLLERGASVKCHDKSGTTPLHYASLKGDKEAVELLLRHGAQAGAANNEGETSFHFAITSGKSEVVTLLLANEIHQPRNPGTRLGCAEITPLVAAAMKGNLDEVIEIFDAFNPEREFMSKVNYINMKDTLGWTVFHFLAYCGHSEIIQHLVSQGGDPQIRDRYDNTPIHLAAEQKHPGAVKVLLAALKEADRAAAVNAPGRWGNSALMRGAWGGCVECVELLVEAGGKLTQVDDDRWTLLMAAADSNHISVVSFLLCAFGAEKEGMLLKDYVNLKNKDGKTALRLAHSECHEVIEHYLRQV